MACTCPTGVCSGRRSPPTLGSRRRAPERAGWPPTTRTPRRWASRRRASRSGTRPRVTRRPTSCSPPPRRPTSTRPTPPRSTPPSALPSHVGAYDLVGSVRSTVAACALADRTGAAGRARDVRTGLPGGADEADGGDAAVAFLFGDGPAALTETIGGASGHGRVPRPLADARRAVVAAVGGALRRARLRAARRGGRHRRARSGGPHRRRRRPRDRDRPAPPGRQRGPAQCRLPRRGDRRRPVATVGNTGAAQAGLLLADVLDRAEPGADDRGGAARRRRRRVDPAHDRRAGRLPAGRRRCRADRSRPRRPVYAQFLTWRGFLPREPPRRPDPTRPAAPPSLRTERWKFGFIGSRDESGSVHLPPARVCMDSGAVDQMEPERLADVPATIATFTVDRLAFR